MRLLDWSRLTRASPSFPPVLEARDVVKDFGGTRALDHVHFSANAGEVHAVLGENGAGKSTLMKIIGGALRPDRGELYLADRPAQFDNPLQAMESGVSVVHQQFTLAPELTVAENIFLGREPRNRWGLVDWKRLFEEARALLKYLDFDLDPRRPVKEIGAGERRVTEIARALSISAKVLIMDEPSAVLGPGEMETLFKIISALRADGKTVVYISHRLDEIFAIADRVSVLRDGRLVGVYELDDQVDREFLVGKMVGRQWTEQFPDKPAEKGRELLRVEHLSRSGAFEDVSFTVHAGEIVGLAGLVGSGRTEVCKAIIGLDPIEAGNILVNGKAVRITSPREALTQGIAYLSEDRHGEGVVACRSVGENITLAVIRRFATRGILKLRSEAEFVVEMMRKTDVRAAGRRQTVSSLSGGNQQKVALAKWLSTPARIFLLDEPTAGIDVGAKSEIYRIIADLARGDAAILLVSSEIPELLAMSTRLLVMKKGRIVARLSAGEATEESVLNAAL